MKPDYLCIGAAKAGTMSLIKYLNLHPDIWCHDGELHFFDDIIAYDNYAGKFPKDKIAGEKSPSYCYLRYAIDNIYKYNKDIKLILLLREPIQRAYSHYNMEINRRRGYSNKPYMHEFKKDMDIKLADIKENDDYYVVRGFYDEIIEYILSKFPRENLYIGIAEEIMKNKNEEYNKIYKFLGAKEICISENLDVHKGRYKKPIPKDLEKMLYEIYKSHNERLYKILGRKIEAWETYYDYIQTQAETKES